MISVRKNVGRQADRKACIQEEGNKVEKKIRRQEGRRRQAGR
jgi:hypothetical protein